MKRFWGEIIKVEAISDLWHGYLSLFIYFKAQTIGIPTSLY